jgi:hypothetical protein
MNIYHSQKPMPYVYMCVHKETGKFYIGYREHNVKLGMSSDQDFPKYKTSSKIIKPFFDEYNWHVAEFFDGTDAYNYEQQLIFENWSNPLLLNRQHRYLAFPSFKLVSHTDETKEKLSKIFKGRKLTDEHRSKLRGPRGPYKNPKGKTSPRKTPPIVMSEASKLARSGPRGPQRNRAPDLTCPHCNLTGRHNAMKRWHFDNCKDISHN